MTDFSENVKKQVKNFGSLIPNNKEKIMLPPPEKRYVRDDGTKVIEKTEEYGKTVTEIHKDGTVIALNFDSREVLRQDYARRANVEVVHHYDELSMKTDEFTNIYDEHNKLAKKIEKIFTYHDNGRKSSESITELPGDIKTIIKFDEMGLRIEKIVQRGTVKTWFDINDKPIKRELDRGAGGIIVEDLTK